MFHYLCQEECKFGGHILKFLLSWTVNSIPLAWVAVLKIYELFYFAGASKCAGPRARANAIMEKNKLCYTILRDPHKFILEKEFCIYCPAHLSRSVFWVSFLQLMNYSTVEIAFEFYFVHYTLYNSDNFKFADRFTVKQNAPLFKGRLHHRTKDSKGFVYLKCQSIWEVLVTIFKTNYDFHLNIVPFIFLSYLLWAELCLPKIHIWNTNHKYLGCGYLEIEHLRKCLG